ncbi:hypothetical protein E7T09_16790 [Deinococcus sp. KSM4-11]|uniref:hypothetical protein n=1 Tax=Deinococcus sp. KSM4-11 TaxID=2568654 RepID=UPI0010A366EF|nr:hypothetical protein [Deinococcus sp. KSM4-11]THF85604.1 hypothetical protein E7T09_16790 [Deinococcus sp. KSM4-11]
MKKPILSALLLGSLLASCAPSMAGAGAPTVVAPGQIWTVDVSGGAVSTVTVGAAKRRDGSQIVTYVSPLHADGAASIEDNVGYAPAGAMPEFMVVGQTRVDAGKKTAFTCLLRNPVDTLNRPEIGLYRFASADDFAKSEDKAVDSLTDGILSYLEGGPTAGDTTCTLTRVK